MPNEDKTYIIQAQSWDEKEVKQYLFDNTGMMSVNYAQNIFMAQMRDECVVFLKLKYPTLEISELKLRVAKQ